MSVLSDIEKLDKLDQVDQIVAAARDIGKLICMECDQPLDLCLHCELP